MSSELKLPELGENILQGTVTKVLVNAGDTIKKGQNILEMETDKAVLEVPSSVDGVIANVLIKNGDVVKVGQSVFKLAGVGATLNTTPTPTRGHVTEAPPLGGDRNVSPSRLPSNEPLNVKAPQGTTPSPTEPTINELKLPSLGENIEQGTITRILVNVGDSIKKGQSIVELETGKSVLEVPSPIEGLIKEVLVQSGAVVKIGQPIFKINAVLPTEEHVTEAPPLKGDRNVPPSRLPSNDPLQRQAPQGTTLSTNAQTNTVHVPVRNNIPAAPSARLLARELGLDIATIPGSGSGGRISIADIKAYCKLLNTTRPTGGTIAQRDLPSFTKWGNPRREPMNNVRKKTAEHLSNAWNTIPHVTQFEKADISELEKLRKSLSTPERKLSITPFLIKTIALGLKKFPQFNTSVDMSSSEIIYKDYINIGVAVDTDRGLLVPVLKNVDKMSIAQIHDELTAVAERARSRKMTIEEMSGGCFTISNLGGIGGTFFTPIVNWPEVAILGVSRGVMEPVYVDGQFVPRLMLPLSLSYDHRIIDGADGARFVRFIAEAITKPEGF